MTNRIPESLRVLVDTLARLPGLGPKSAMRVAMTLLKWPAEETRRFGATVYELRDKLHLCSRCGGLTEQDPCVICSDPARSEDTLCLVSEWDAMLALDEGGFFSGQYVILGGLLAPLDHSDSGNLDTERLSARLAEGKIKELILALGATLEAENTASFIRNLVNRKFPEVHITRLAQGIPLGSEIKFMDRETLRQSLKFRQPLDHVSS